MNPNQPGLSNLILAIASMISMARSGLQLSSIIGKNHRGPMLGKSLVAIRAMRFPCCNLLKGGQFGQKCACWNCWKCWKWNDIDKVL